MSSLETTLPCIAVEHGNDNTPLGNETSVGLWKSQAYPAVNERMKLSVQQVTQLKTDMSELH